MTGHRTSSLILRGNFSQLWKWEAKEGKGRLTKIGRMRGRKERERGNREIVLEKETIRELEIQIFYFRVRTRAEGS